jgi:hypothetical protein
MIRNGIPITDGEYLRLKEEELERTMRHAESLQELITSLRRFVRSQGGYDVSLPSLSDRKRPSREERVMQLLREGERSLDDLARAFKIQKSEMRRWMDERLGSSRWTKTQNGKGYTLS